MSAILWVLASKTILVSKLKRKVNKKVKILAVIFNAMVPFFSHPCKFVNSNIPGISVSLICYIWVFVGFVLIADLRFGSCKIITSMCLTLFLADILLILSVNSTIINHDEWCQVEGETL